MRNQEKAKFTAKESSRRRNHNLMNSGPPLYRTLRLGDELTTSVDGTIRDGIVNGINLKGFQVAYDIRGEESTYFVNWHRAKQIIIFKPLSN